MLGILNYSATLITLAATLALFSLGLNLQWGMAGLVNFGHVSFMALGSYTTVLLTLSGVVWYVAAPIGATVAAALGLLIGLATLRLREDYLGIVTIGVAELLRLVIKNERPLGWLTRGDFGIQNFPKPFWPNPQTNPLFGWLTPDQYPWVLLAVVLGVLLGTLALLQRLTRSPWGRVLRAIREDEAVVTALGKNVFAFKLQAFVLGGAFAGLSGAFYAWHLRAVYPSNFMPEVTFQAWMIVAIGGAGSHWGVLVGAAVFQLYNSLPRFLPEIGPGRTEAIQIMLIGLTLIAVMIWRPQGLLGKKAELTLNK
ncbi:MAG: branched-chain amino acid ABC transporter permease [Oscillatoriales cyanobacterium SM2_2_1]|nr:branched-chain amino acid ABC transporter permease [Oscillatoriales cyanobacterium SM2_2_1]